MGHRKDRAIDCTNEAREKTKSDRPPLLPQRPVEGILWVVESIPGDSNGVGVLTRSYFAESVESLPRGYRNVSEPAVGEYEAKLSTSLRSSSNGGTFAS